MGEADNDTRAARAAALAGHSGFADGRPVSGVGKDWLVVALIAVLVLAPWPIFALSIKPETHPHILAIPADGPGLSSPVSQCFARSRFFMVVDLKRKKQKLLVNPFVGEKHAVGLRIAHLLVNEKVGVIIAKNIGPEPYSNLSARGTRVYVGSPSSVRDAIHQLNNKQLVRATGPTVQIHYGLEQQGKDVPPPPSEPCPWSGPGAAPAAKAPP